VGVSVEGLPDCRDVVQHLVRERPAEPIVALYKLLVLMLESQPSVVDGEPHCHIMTAREAEPGSTEWGFCDRFVHFGS
jgi:hypothetical protein